MSVERLLAQCVVLFLSTLVWICLNSLLIKGGLIGYSCSYWTVLFEMHEFVRQFHIIPSIRAQNLNDCVVTEVAIMKELKVYTGSCELSGKCELNASSEDNSLSLMSA